MKTIKTDELFQTLSGFLKDKGVEFKDGAYTQHIRSACNLLCETINVTQRTANKARKEVADKLDQLRQRIHDATAPKSSPKAAPNKSSVRKTAKRNQSTKRSKARRKA